MKSLEISKEQFVTIKENVQRLYAEDIKAIEKTLKLAGAPYTPGRLEKTSNN